MMNNSRYLPENLEQCRLEETILLNFPYNLKVRSRWIALIQDGGKNMKVLIETLPLITFGYCACFKMIFKFLSQLMLAW